MQIASLQFKARAGAKLADVKLQAALRKLQGNFVKGRADRMLELDNFDAIRDAAAAIRNRTLANLDVYLETFERNATAGGAVVHNNAGAAALAVVLVLGNRRGWPREAMPPHNLPFTILGTGILWFGWFGFNAGSALGANGLAAQALVNTHLAAATAMLSWLVVEKLRSGHATSLGAASGAVAGLVAITPCAGFVGGMAPVAIGAVAGAVCYLALRLKTKFGFDDSLDVIAVHLVGGLLGALLLGLFADTKVNALGFDGLFFGGGTDLLVDQVVASAATLAFSFGVTFVVAKILNATMGIRVSTEDELVGLDQSQHAESAYQA